MKRALVLAVTHAAAIAVGFVAGVYFLPILIAPPAPPMAQVEASSKAAQYRGEFRRALKDSDALHWGEGTVFVGRDAITLKGRVAPGPDYKVYLSPEFVETEADFARVKPRMIRVGEVKTFENFIVPLAADVDPSRYDTVIVWCESFGQFITAAKYR